MQLRTFAGLTLVGIGTIISVTQAYLLRSVLISIEAEFGFGNYLSIFFWIGFFSLLIGVYLVNGSNNDIYYLWALLLLTVVIWGMPSFAEELPHHQDSFWHMTTARWISENNYLAFPSFKAYTRLAYLQYPSLFLVTAALRLVAAPDEILTMNLYIIGITAIFTLNFYLLARWLLNSKNKAFTATFLALAGNIAMFPNHFSPSATASAFFPLMIYMLLRTRSLRQRENVVCLFVLILFYVTLHPVMPLLFLVVVMSLLFIYIMPRFVKSQVFSNFGILLFAMLMYFGWGLFISHWGFTELGQDLSRFVATIFELGKETTLGTTILRRQTLVFPLVGWIKRGIFLVFIVPALLILVKKFLKRHLNNFDIIFLTTFVAWFLSSLVTEISDRFLVWVIPFATLVLFGKKMTSFSWKAPHIQRLLQLAPLFALLLITPLTFLTYYSGEAGYVTTKAEYAGFQYLVKNIRENDLIFGKITFKYDLYFCNSQRNYLFTSSIEYATIAYFPSSLYSWQYWTEGKASNSFTVALNQCNNDPHFNRIFSNTGFTIFRRAMNVSDTKINLR